MLMRPYTEDQAIQEPHAGTAGDAVAAYRAEIARQQSAWRNSLDILKVGQDAVRRQIDVVLMGADPEVRAIFNQDQALDRHVERIEVKSYRDAEGELDVAAWREALRDQQRRNHKRVETVLSQHADVMEQIAATERGRHRNREAA